MSEWIKYLSPAVMLGVIWGIVQFYQKRKDEKHEKRRDEKLIIYNSIYTAIGSINFEIMEFLSNSRPSLFLFKEEVRFINKSINNLGERSALLQEKIDAVKNNSNVEVNKINDLESEWEKNKKLLQGITLKQAEANVENITKHNIIFEQLVTVIKSKSEEINSIPILIISKK